MNPTSTRASCKSAAYPTCSGCPSCAQTNFLSQAAGVPIGGKISGVEFCLGGFISGRYFFDLSGRDVVDD